MNNQLRSIYLEHVNHTFPREFLLHSKIVSNEDEYLRGISELNGKRDLYVTVYAFESDISLEVKEGKYSKPIIDTIYIDLDYKDENGEGKPFVAYLDLFNLLEYLLSDGVVPRVYFSGNKGFNVYIDFERLELRYPKEAIKRFVCQLEDATGVKTIDSRVIGDISRVSRIPNTLNLKSKRYCVPLVISDVMDEDKSITSKLRKFKQILDLSQSLRKIALRRFNSNRVREILQRIDRNLIEEVVEVKTFRFAKNKRKLKRSSKKADEFRPCIRRIYNSLDEVTHLNHNQRQAICYEAIFSGFNVDEIVSFFENMSDFGKNEERGKKTRYFVDHALERSYLMEKRIPCKTLCEWGICTPDGCSKARKKIKEWSKVS